MNNISTFEEQIATIFYYNDLLSKNCVVLPDNHYIKNNYNKFNNEQLYRPCPIWIEYAGCDNISRRVEGHLIFMEEIDGINKTLKLLTSKNEVIKVTLYSTYPVEFGDLPYKEQKYSNNDDF